KEKINMKTEILLSSIFNYQQAEENASSAYYESIYSFRTTLLLLLCHEYNIDLPIALNPPMNAITRTRPSGYEFNLTQGETVGSKRFECYVNKSGEISFKVLFCTHEAQGGMRAAWETILDSRLQPESKGKNFLSIETFTSMI